MLFIQEFLSKILSQISIVFERGFSNEKIYENGGLFDCGIGDRFFFLLPGFCQACPVWQCFSRAGETAPVEPCGRGCFFAGEAPRPFRELAFFYSKNSIPAAKHWT